MTSDTVQCEVCRFGMAARTSDPDTAHTIQIHTVAKCTGVLNIPGLIMVGIIRARPIGRVSVISSMTRFATVAACRCNADIETRIAAWTTGFGMTGLTDSQVRSGVWAVETATEVSSVNRVRNCDTRSEVFQAHC